MTLRALLFLLTATIHSSLFPSISYAETINVEKLHIWQEKENFSGDIQLNCKHSSGKIKKICKKDKCRGPTGPIGPVGPVGPVGPTGATGPGGVFTQTYGRLYNSTQTTLDFTEEDPSLAVPFTLFAPASGTSGTTISPATITILTSGVYTLNTCLYFSSTDPNEGAFVQSTYTLGTKINDEAIALQAAVAANDPGEFSLNYSDLIQLSQNDTIQFYIQASNLGGNSDFNNQVTLIRASATLVQVGN